MRLSPSQRGSRTSSSSSSSIASISRGRYRSRGRSKGSSVGTSRSVIGGRSGTRGGSLALVLLVLALACGSCLEASSADAVPMTAEGGVGGASGGGALPVVIVGGGLAGLSAAAELAAKGSPVVIVEKTDRLGGNSAKASSGMNSAGSAPQVASGIQDSPELFAQDTIRSGKGLSNPALVEAVAQGSASAIDFLHTFGLNLTEIQQLGGHSVPRTHRAAPDGKPMNVGFRIMSTLIQHCQDLQAKDPVKFQILTGARAVGLLTGLDSAGGLRVTGVRVATKVEAQEQEKDIPAASVLLATGGFSSDRAGLLREHAPSLAVLPTTNGPFATGDGVRLGMAVGAALKDMDQVQVHPTGLVDPQDPMSPVKILGPEILRGSGGVLLNSEGRRFVNELTTRDQVVNGMWQHCQPLSSFKFPPPKEDKPQAQAQEGQEAGDAVGAGGAAVEMKPIVGSHLILTDEAVKKFGEAPAKFYLFKGLMKKFASLDELCDSLGLPLEAVRASLEAYDKAASGEGGAKDPFGKTVFPCRFTANLAPQGGEGEAEGGVPPIYAAVVTPVLHYTMGGLQFDEQGHVLRPVPGRAQEREPVPGLLAAGEVTGGLHGGNRLAGNSLLECVVFGRIAAQTTLAEQQQQGSAGDGTGGNGQHKDKREEL